MKAIDRLADMTEPQLRELFDDLLAAMTERLPPKTAMILLVADDPGLVQFASNIRRRDVAARLCQAAADRIAQHDVDERVPFMPDGA